MIDLNDIKLYLPKYLSASTQDELFSELKAFPDNIDGRLYTNALAENMVIYQGDGLRSLLVVRIPDLIPHYLPSIILSNTCDISPDNQRFQAINVLYSPIYNLAKYRHLLLKTWAERALQIDDHIMQIKKQKVTSIFYLPAGGKLADDSFVFLDQVLFCPQTELSISNLIDDRMFTLSQYGHYLFLFKLAVHFSRARESVDRNNPSALVAKAGI